MSRCRLPLASCANGCPEPPKAPSLVLCAKCMAQLTAKMQRIIDEWPTPNREGESRG